jgi:glycosyltransferase involved in cell wall biosynthesis
MYGKIIALMPGKSRRILILATSYLPLIGGAELAIKYLTDHLPDFSFDLITSRPHPDLPFQEKLGNVHVYRVGGSSDLRRFFLPKILLPLSLFQKARELIDKHEYDLVYILQASQAGGAGWLLKNFGRIHIPILLNLQEGKNLQHQPFLLRQMRNLAIGAADYAVVISTYLKKYLIAEGFPEDRIFLLPNGVSHFNPGDSESTKSSLGITDEKVIITVSRLVEKNGIRDLIEGFAQVKRDHPNLKLVIIGEGPLKHDLYEKVKKLGIENAVVFVGSVPHEKIANYLSCADIFIRPSYSEGLGSAFLEAMIAGVPIIGTPVGGITDFLIDGKTGLFCKPGDPESIAHATSKLLENASLRQQLIDEAQILVSTSYTWNSIAATFKKIYELVLEKSFSTL